MSQHHHAQKNDILNPNLVALVLVINFLVIGIMIFSNTSVTSSESDGEEIGSAAIDSTETMLPTETPLKPTATATRTSTPIPTNTPSPTITPTIVPSATSTQQEQVGVNLDEVEDEDVGVANYDPSLIEKGESLFTQCAACHGPDARGVPNLGKDLVDSEFVKSQSDEELLTFIKTGRPIWDPANTTGIDMPPKGGNPTLADEDIEAIIAYLRSLSDQSSLHPASESTSISDADYDAAVVEQGEELFTQCAACHGPDARGIPNLGKDLVGSEFVKSQTDEELLAFIKTGRPLWDPENTTGIDMPPKGGNPTLTDEQILAIIAYLRSLP